MRALQVWKRPNRCEMSLFRKRKTWAIVLTVVAVSSMAVTAWFRWRTSLTVVVGKEWSPDERISITDVDHSDWSRLLAQYVTSDGRVDYAAWKRSRDGISRLDAYLDHLSRVDGSQSASREDRLAFWINAYNALTIRGILREYPTTSIRNHVSHVGYNIWKHYQLRVGDESYSLSAIEHEILRPLGEPRIHFAIVCASIGCPPLRNETYVPERLEEQLTDNARRFFSQQQNFRIDRQYNRVELSSIFNWFAGDFGETRREQLDAIAPWLPSEQARKFIRRPDVTVRYLDYDWDLNDRTEQRDAGSNRNPPTNPDPMPPPHSGSSSR